MRPAEHQWAALPPQAREYVRQTLASTMSGHLGSAAFDDLNDAIDEIVQEQIEVPSGEGLIGASMEAGIRVSLEMARNAKAAKLAASVQAVAAEAFRIAIDVLGEP